MRWYIMLLCVCSLSVNAQYWHSPYSPSPEPATLFPESVRSRWFNLQGSFLEPNRFALVYDLNPSRIRIEAGFGGEVIRVGITTIGGEILVWSGLKTLDNFRFPVETADYFFGLYAISVLFQKDWSTFLNLRTRISHISSHIVDGAADSLIGGSSSKFSREFVSVEAMLEDRKRNIIASAGIKYIFHQVEKNEAEIQIPLVVDYKLLKLNASTSIHSFLSTCGGPSIPLYSAGMVLRKKTGDDRTIELYGEYHAGRSRYGVDRNVDQSGFEVGIRIAGRELK